MKEIPEKTIRLRHVMRSLEALIIKTALKRTRDNRAQAGRLLGINRTTLVEKLKVLDDLDPWPSKNPVEEVVEFLDVKRKK